VSATFYDGNGIVNFLSGGRFIPVWSFLDFNIIEQGQTVAQRWQWNATVCVHIYPWIDSDRYPPSQVGPLLSRPGIEEILWWV
jgi:hypothetical protein